MARTHSIVKQARIDAAVHDTLASVFNSFRNAAIAYKISQYPTNFNATQFSFQVPPQTVRDRASGKRVPQKSLVNEAQEKVLVDWCHHNSDSATPLHPRTLRGRVLEMVGICPAKPRGLDPKRAQNFNKVTIMEYFDMQKALNEKHDGIPLEHNWNVDEKGCQMDGDRKGDNSKFVFSKSNLDRYRIRSDNLELVTTIECVSAAGDSIPASFIVADGLINTEYWNIEGIGGSVNLQHSFK
ncbi:hypothetical protein AZE42_08547 [Rhizopogon vesiculosus]|uniref:DDE-1 domain-containing protein n=1 Tax=Rhizopogon vesiculosus TaxID=180088 RepID=A0A1J8R471_9AGAM|nr:hypothetical protein AZE42_08547 [Rhizopogon vesiculosus]